MPAPSHSDRSSKKQPTVNRTPNLEQLEARMMSTVSGLENALQLLNSPLFSSGFSAGVNSAPTVNSEARLANGTSVSGKTASLAVLGSDDAGESKLTYSWSVSSKPNGATVSFSVNGGNSAKNTVATFSKAGDYVFGVSITDAGGLRTTSSVTVSVGQTLTTLSLFTADNKSVNPSSGLSITAKTQGLTVRALDQFGQTMVTQPEFQWSTLSSPSGAAPTLTPSGASVQIDFTKAGSYRFQVAGGGKTAAFNLTLSQVATSLKVTGPDSSEIASGVTVATGAASQRYSTQVLDQFGNAMSSQPTINWTTPTVPNGGKATVSVVRDAATVAFTKAGTYTVRAQTGSAIATFSINVSQTLTRLAIFTADNKEVKSNVAVALATVNHKFSFKALDQFGNLMTNQPDYSWSTLQAPVGGSATFAGSGANTTVTFTAGGNYRFRVSSDSLTFDFTVTVSQAATSVRVLQPDGTEVTGGSDLAIVGATQALKTQVYDQFGNLLANQPAVAWTVTKTPTGGSATAAANKENTLLTFKKAGAYTFRAVIGTGSVTFSTTVAQTLTSLVVLNSEKKSLSDKTNNGIAATSQTLSVSAVDQFGQALISQPSFTWSNTSSSGTSAPSLVASGVTAAITYGSAGIYGFRVEGGGASFSFNVQVNAVAAKVVVKDASSNEIKNNTSTASSGVSSVVTARVLDQFGNELGSQPTISWTTSTVPSGAKATFTVAAGQTTLGFNKAGNYTFKATSGSLSLSFTVNVAQTLTSITVTPGASIVGVNGTKQFSAMARDQFQASMTSQPTFTWSVSGGAISTSGLFTAPADGATVTVTASAGGVNGSTSVIVATSSESTKNISNSGLATAVQGYLSDKAIDRNEMIQLLRSTGADGKVDASELADLKYIVANPTLFNLADYVRVLASNVVNGNTANAKYLGQTLGNLAANSTATQLNNLVDKWFLGTDLPTLTGNGISYKTASGSLFGANPSHLDEKQGQLGDCYFISTLGTLADKNPQAVKNMFVDNGDGTYTVRFYYGTYQSWFNTDGSINAGFSSGAGIADYVTVNKQVAAYSNGVFAYSNYGGNVASTANVLWIVLAEKAYAQWNETGRSGRNNTNTFAGIEGGLMDRVNAQVLGYNSTDYLMSSAPKSAVVNAIQNGLAVTIGTIGSASAGGLVGSHAYAVTGYDAATDKFTLYNPWGMMHPTPLSWDQLKSNCSIVTLADASKSTNFSSAAPKLSLRSEFAPASFAPPVTSSSSVLVAVRPTATAVETETEVETGSAIESAEVAITVIETNLLALESPAPASEQREGSAALAADLVDAVFDAELLDSLFA